MRALAEDEIKILKQKHRKMLQQLDEGHEQQRQVIQELHDMQRNKEIDKCKQEIKERKMKLIKDSYSLTASIFRHSQQEAATPSLVNSTTDYHVKSGDIVMFEGALHPLEQIVCVKITTTCPKHGDLLDVQAIVRDVDGYQKNANMGDLYKCTDKLRQ